MKPSSAQWIRGPIVLSNGWSLEGFDAGNTNDLALTDPKTKKIVWTVRPAHYPEFVIGYKDLLLVAYGYLTDEAVIFAHRAGGQQATWSIDFNKLLVKPGSRERALSR